MLQTQTNSPLSVNLQIAKSFDTIDHDAILGKLGKFGSDQNFLQFLQNTGPTDGNV